jgi:site-specific recombinase XerD
MPKAVRRLSITPVVSPKLSETIYQFISFKEAQGMSERTLSDYRNNLSKFLQHSEQDSMEMDSLEATLLSYLKQYKDMSPVTYNLRYKNLHCFLAWAVERDLLKANPLKRLGLKARKEEGKIRHHEPDTIQKLLKAIDSATYTGLRDYSLILLTLDTGIRPSEAFGLKIDDFDSTYKKIQIRSEVAKTRTARELPLSTPVVETIKKLISVRFEQFGDLLFISCDGYPLNRNSWNRRLTTYCKEAGCPQVAPYDLRHTFAIMFLRNGGNVFALQKIMGHADLEMTKRYVVLSESDIEKQHAVASPVNNFIKRSSRVKRLLK